MKRAVRMTAVLGLFLVMAVVATVGVIYMSPSLSSARLENANRHAPLYDVNDKLIEEGQAYQRVRMDDLPRHVPMAFVAVEDKSFYNHGGISYGRVGKAAYRNIQAGRAKEGASTISQQLIKNTHLSHEKTMTRKIKEASLARKLESRYEKDQILEMYLNAVYFGNGVYGLEGAAQYYFDRPAAKLSPHEAAALAGLLRGPGYYDPHTHPQRFSERASFVLFLMWGQGHITEAEYDAAKKEEIVVAPKRTRLMAPSAYGYRAAAMAQAAGILGKGQSEISAAGYKIFTYQDVKAQERMNRTITAGSYHVVDVSGNTADAAAVLADVHGGVRAAYYSSPVLIGARRNFASAMKPLLVYAPAVEMGVVSPATYINDTPYAAGDFHPRNHDGVHRGPVTVRESVVHSHNIPAARVLDYVGVDRACDVARRMGALPAHGKEGVHMSLGVTEAGTSFDELLAGYCVIANGGTRVAPSFVRHITDRNGNVVWRHMQTQERVVGADTAFLVTDMLRDTVKHGTARKLNSVSNVAAKTGTAERGGAETNTDATCVAYTAEDVLVVWHGNASMRVENDLPRGGTGGGVTAFVARDIIRESKASGWKVPDTVAKMEFDIIEAKDGKMKLANEMTPNAERGRDYFAMRHAPREVSGRHKEPKPAKLDGKIADTGVPAVWFTTRPYQSYEIYKRDGKSEKLQEVINGDGSEYTYMDKNAKPKGSAEYFVISKVVGSSEAMQSERSNTVKLFTGPAINPESKAVVAKKRDSGKLWFF